MRRFVRLWGREIERRESGGRTAVKRRVCGVRSLHVNERISALRSARNAKNREQREKTTETNLARLCRLPHAKLILFLPAHIRVNCVVIAERTS